MLSDPRTYSHNIVAVNVKAKHCDACFVLSAQRRPILSWCGSRREQKTPLYFYANEKHSSVMCGGTLNVNIDNTNSTVKFRKMHDIAVLSKPNYTIKRHLDVGFMFFTSHNIASAVTFSFVYTTCSNNNNNNNTDIIIPALLFPNYFLPPHSFSNRNRFR
jgi:hypothetical protein